MASTFATYHLLLMFDACLLMCISLSYLTAELDLWKFLKGNLQQHLELLINSRRLDRSLIRYPLLMWQLGRRKTEAQKSLSAGHHEVQ